MGRQITDDDYTFVYFEVIKQLGPQRILDVGLFLQRIGALCRQAMSCEIPADTVLDGVDVFGGHFPIYDRVYDAVFAGNPADGAPSAGAPFCGTGFAEISGGPYDLICAMDVTPHMGPDTRAAFFKALPALGRSVLADCTDPQFNDFLVQNYELTPLSSGGKQFVLGNLKEGK
ncbi:MAG: hypothetical protein K5840_03725 [Eubacterium sp.]|nr:hypothetical protein [Eubacterium sp.]